MTFPHNSIRQDWNQQKDRVINNPVLFDEVFYFFTRERNITQRMKHTYDYCVLSDRLCKILKENKTITEDQLLYTFEVYTKSEKNNIHRICNKLGLLHKTSRSIGSTYTINAYMPSGWSWGY